MLTVEIRGDAYNKDRVIDIIIDKIVSLESDNYARVVTPKLYEKRGVAILSFTKKDQYEYIEYSKQVEEVVYRTIIRGVNFCYYAEISIDAVREMIKNA